MAPAALNLNWDPNQAQIISEAVHVTQLIIFCRLVIFWAPEPPPKSTRTERTERKAIDNGSEDHRQKMSPGLPRNIGSRNVISPLSAVDAID